MEISTINDSEYMLRGCSHHVGSNLQGHYIAHLFAMKKGEGYWITANDNHEFHIASLETVQQSIMFFYSIVTEDDRQNLSLPFFAGIRRKKTT